MSGISWPGGSVSGGIVTVFSFSDAVGWLSLPGDPMKKLLLPLALIAFAAAASAQNAPKDSPKKATCPQACKDCPKAGKAACKGQKDCPKKADCPKAKKS
jgi:hypothetical protein